MAADTDQSLMEAERRRAALAHRQNRVEDVGGVAGKNMGKYAARGLGMAGEAGARAATRGAGEAASSGAAILAGLPTAGIASPFVKAGGSAATTAAEQGVGLTARMGRKAGEMAAEKVGQEVGRRAAGAAYGAVTGRERASIAALEAQAGQTQKDPLLTDSSRLVYTGAKLAAKLSVTAATTALSLVLSPLMMFLIPMAILMIGFMVAALYITVFV